MLGVLVGLLCAASWASGSILMRDLARKLDPFTLNAPRSLVGGLAALAITLFTGRAEGYQAITPDKLFFMLISMGIGGCIGDSFYTISLGRIGVARAFPVANTYPALTLLLGLAFLQEQFDPRMAAGLVFVIAGVIVISRTRHADTTGTAAPGVQTGIPFALIASVCWAASMILVAPGIDGLDSIMVASIRVPALSLVLWGVVATRKTFPRLRTLSRREWLIIVAGGLIGWGLGSVLFVMAVSMLGPTRAAILTSTSPFFALPLSAIFLREKVGPRVLMGTVLTVAGVILVS
ncbi:MAG: DMT family transporter [Anaerolineae bacterium]|jgi:drug/metabolite transporter (DMT)-like permease